MKTKIETLFFNMTIVVSSYKYVKKLLFFFRNGFPRTALVCTWFKRKKKYLSKTI